MVAPELRNLHVSLHPCAHYQAEGVQEAVFHPATEKQYVLYLIICSIPRHDKCIATVAGLHASHQQEPISDYACLQSPSLDV